MRCLSVVVALVVVGAASVACSSAPPGAPDHLVGRDPGQASANDTQSSPGEGEATAAKTPDAPESPPAAAPAPAPSAPADAPPVAKTYHGTVETPLTVTFGGSPYCYYDVTLSTVAIEIAILDDGTVQSASVSDHMTEKAVSCSYPPMAPNDQQFTMASSRATSGGTRIELAGAKTNTPDTSLVVDLVATGDGYDAHLAWKRVDQKAPLDWSVSATASLASK